ITPEDEENEIQQIELITATALGSPETNGTITVACQTVTIQIQQIILVILTTPQPSATCLSAQATLKAFRDADKIQDRLEKADDRDGSAADKAADKLEKDQEKAQEKALKESAENACGGKAKDKPKDKPTDKPKDRDDD
ncbi:MAG: hypothetical protein LC721_01210, partial [Actinobacteria bacterium]|nr:hypothetical protein [Actinomycetota bacterium]